MMIESGIDFSNNTNTGINAEPLSQQSPIGEMPTLMGEQIGGHIELELFDSYYDLDSINHGYDYGHEYRLDEGVDIEPTKDDGGGHNVFWTDDGEWLEYGVNLTEGTYNINVRVASENSDPGSLRVKLDDELLGTVDVTGTGGWQDWQTFSIEGVELTGGKEQQLRLEIQDGGFNLNWLEFESVNNSSNNSPKNKEDNSPKNKKEPLSSNGDD